MAKNNTSSKYNRYQKQDDKATISNKNKSKSTKGIKDTKDTKNTNIFKNKDLDATTNLDISFIDGKNKKKPVLEKTEILDVEEIVKANEAFNSEKPTSNFKMVSLILGGVCLVLMFTVCYFLLNGSTTNLIQKEIIKEVPVVDDNYVFLGDSITDWYDLDKYFEGLPVVNSGVSGYSTNNILNNMNKMVYQYNPSKVFILIGINDLELKVDDDVVVNNIRKIVQGIKKNRRYAKIYVESIYPINNSDDDKIEGSIINGNRKNSDIIDINNKLIKLAEEEGVTYIDLYKELVDDNGLLKIEYTVDGLHLSSEGYEKVTEVLRKYINE